MATIFYPTIIGDVSPNQVAAKLGDADDATALAAAATAIGLDDKLDLSGGTMTGDLVVDDASIYTEGQYAYIYTEGQFASIYTNGGEAGIYTNGAGAGIFTYGSNAGIFTNGNAAEIFTNGDNADISTIGTNAHISTLGTNAHIQTRSTFKLSNGTHVTTLSHAPTANRAIAFPDAGGTVMLETLSGVNASTARTNLSAVGSVTTGVSGAAAITNMMSLTQAQYNAITPAANTLYVIV
jgi:hypothetical protein